MARDGSGAAAPADAGRDRNFFESPRSTRARPFSAQREPRGHRGGALAHRGVRRREQYEYAHPRRAAKDSARSGAVSARISLDERGRAQSVVLGLRRPPPAALPGLARRAAFPSSQHKSLII